MNIIDIGLFAGYILVIISTLAAIILPLVHSLGDPKSLLKSGIGVAVILVIFLIAYATADGGAEGNVSSTTSKMVGGGIVTMYILFFVAIVGIVYTEIAKIVK